MTAPFARPNSLMLPCGCVVNRSRGTIMTWLLTRGYIKLFDLLHSESQVRKGFRLRGFRCV